jgi:glycosyltransferase involved in cell wall biosynthesis
VVVGNPGSIPEIFSLAGGLARAGMLERFILPLSDRTGGPLGLPRRLPGRAGVRVRSELSRRSVPADVAPHSVRHEASVAEMLFVASQRLGYSSRRTAKLLERRDRLFDRRLSEHVSADHDAVVATHGAAHETLARAAQAGVVSFLHCPIAHHRYAEDLLQEEAEREPAFAPTLQLHRLSPAWKDRLEAELDTADRILVLSSAQARSFAAAGVDPDKLLVTPLGVDLTTFHPLQREADGIFRIVFVGQVGQRKGISYLLEAFTKAGIPDSELVLAGQSVGTARPWEGRAGVRHVRHRPRRELPDLYARSDVFVLPSLVEGFGLTALEAMACGLPVVVSENTFGHDVVEDRVSGYVVPIRDPEAIARALRELYDDPGGRRRMGAAARERAKQFSWSEHGDRTAAVIADEGSGQRD